MKFFLWVLYGLGYRGRWWKKEKLRIYNDLKKALEVLVAEEEVERISYPSIWRNRFPHYYLCHRIKNFTFLNIESFPELWDRKAKNHTCRNVWFKDNKERLQYINEAIELVKQKL